MGIKKNLYLVETDNISLPRSHLHNTIFIPSAQNVSIRFYYRYSWNVLLKYASCEWPIRSNREKIFLCPSSSLPLAHDTDRTPPVLVMHQISPPKYIEGLIVKEYSRPDFCQTIKHYVRVR